MSMNDEARGYRPNALFWATPGLAVLGGVVYFIAAAASGRPGLGAVMFGIMLVFAAGIALAGWRSETVRGLLDHRDERFAGMDLRATATSGVAVILAVIVGGVVELALGHSGAPYTWLAMVAAAGYLGSVVLHRLRG